MKGRGRGERGGRTSGRAEGAPHDGAEKVGDLLGGLLRKLGLEKELAGQSAVARWEEVVGARIAAVARARNVSRGILFVEVRSSAWISELTLMRHDILKRLNAGEEAGRIDRIVFVLAEDAAGAEGSGGDDGRGG